MLGSAEAVGEGRKCFEIPREREREMGLLVGCTGGIRHVGGPFKGPGDAVSSVWWGGVPQNENRRHKWSSCMRKGSPVGKG